MIKIAICDDEQCFYDSIHRYINGYMSHRREECEVNIFSSGEELLGKVEALREYTIIFMDINMQGMSGYDAALEIRKYNKDAFIVFVTAYLDYSTEGYKVGAIRYLIKDALLEDRITECMNAIFDKIGEMDAKMAVEFSEGLKIFLPDDVVYVESRRHYMMFHFCGNCENATYKVRGAFSDYIERLGGRFIRIHRSYLINARHVSVVKPDGVRMSNGDVLPISRTKYNDIKNAIFRLMD